MHPRPHRRRSALALVLVGIVSALATTRPVRAAEDDPPSEWVLKAQFFERFTRFVIWPESRGPFVVCLAADNRLATEIERLALRVAFKGRPTQVKRLSMGATIDPRSCHALYIDEAARPFLSMLVARTRGTSVLTVADTAGFGESGVLINMFLEGRFVRFEVNGPAARASPLKLSSQLMRLARIIEGAPGR